jgi:hypothetical protein
MSATRRNGRDELLGRRERSEEGVRGDIRRTDVIPKMGGRAGKIAVNIIVLPIPTFRKPSFCRAGVHFVEAQR